MIEVFEMVHGKLQVPFTQKFSLCEIFRGLNFQFSWLKPPTKIGRHENFATLTVCSMERWLLSSEKKLCVCGYHVYNDIWGAAVRETLVCVREPRKVRSSGR